MDRIGKFQEALVTIKDRIMAEPQSWHLSKSVPISIIIGLVMQFGGFVWFASQQTQQVAHNTDAIGALAVEVKDVKSDAVTQAIQLGRIEAIIENTQASVARVERHLSNGSNR